MNLQLIFHIAILNLFVQNFVVKRFLGLCPFIGQSDDKQKALGMGLAVTFVMTMASFVTYLVYAYFLQPGSWFLTTVFGAEANIAGTGLVDVLKTASYILVIASLVQFVEMFLRRYVPALYRAMGIYLALITTNCAVMGVALLNTTDAPRDLGLAGAVLQGFFAGVGFTLVMLLMAGIRERLQYLNVPRCFKGAPIAFLCTGLMALAFLGFAGMAG
ncbi:MAG: electron transport complex protein RnfA [Planctomycetota bacterium]